VLKTVKTEEYALMVKDKAINDTASLKNESCDFVSIHDNETDVAR